MTQQTARRSRPFFLYSEGRDAYVLGGRDAYVLGGIGSLFGPVFQIRWGEAQPENTGEHPPG